MLWRSTKYDEMLGKWNFCWLTCDILFKAHEHFNNIKVSLNISSFSQKNNKIIWNMSSVWMTREWKKLQKKARRSLLQILRGIVAPYEVVGLNWVASTSTSFGFIQSHNLTHHIGQLLLQWSPCRCFSIFLCVYCKLVEYLYRIDWI